MDDGSTYSSPARLARHARRALVLVVAVDVVVAAVLLYRLRLLDRADAGDFTALADLFASDDYVNAASIASVVALLVAAVTFIRWFAAAYRNLPALGAADRRYGQGWAIGGWFVPILWLWRPKQIANDMWRASDPDEGGDDAPSDGAQPVSWLLTGWWLAFVFGTWVWSFVLSRYLRATTADPLDPNGPLRSTTHLDLVATAIDVVAAVLAILVVGRLTARQDTKAARLLGAGSQADRALHPRGA